MLWVDRTYSALELDLEFYVLLWKHTHTHTFTCLCYSGNVAIVVDRRSSVPPNHTASFRLSGSLGTYSKWWLTHTDTHTHSDSLESLGWGCFEVTRHKDIILIQSWVNCRTFTRIFPQGSILFKKKGKKKGKWIGVEESSVSWYRCITPCTWT